MTVNTKPDTRVVQLEWFGLPSHQLEEPVVAAELGQSRLSIVLP